MIRGALLLALATQAAADDPMPIGWRAPTAGDEIWLEHRTVADLPLQARFGDKVYETALFKAHEQRVHYRIGTPSSQMTVSWSQGHVQDRGPDGSRDRDLPVHGKTYTVDRRTGTVRGGSRPDEVRTALQASDLPQLLEGIRRMLGENPRPGDQVPAGALFAGLVRDAPGESVVTGTLTFGDRREDGLLPVEIAVHLSSSGVLEGSLNARMEADLRGQLLVDLATGWTRSLDVEGPIRLEGEGLRWGRPFTVTGTGRFESHTVLRTAGAEP